MTGWVYVLEPVEYAQWLSSGPVQSPAARGLALVQQLGCNSCHRDDSLRRAPVVEGLFGQPVQLTSGELVRADASYLRESILNPNARVVAGYQPIMPTFADQVGEEDLFALIAYLEAIGPGPGSPSPDIRPTPATAASPAPSPSPPPAGGAGR
jgi:cytochrome c oxidase subunit II